MSVASDTVIANLALSKLGGDQIGALDENSVTAKKVLLHYDVVRDGLLRSHRWNFAAERAELTASVTTPDFGYTYQYPLPADCLRVRELNGVQADLIDAIYMVEGGNILTDASVAKILYTKAVTDTTLFDSLFVEAFVTKLAAELAVDISQSSQKKSELISEFESIDFSRAVQIDAYEGRSPVVGPGRNSASLIARGSGYSGSSLGTALANAGAGVSGGATGADGSNGWTAETAIVAYGDLRIIQIVGWSGGTGATPRNWLCRFCWDRG